ncbi:PTS sugar transporter subunit IIC [Pseudoflavonifractor sp. DSM 107456]|uniref:PTS sugar transporter subunit IIC n=1 Tax=Pseudoflavonifractor gallinarum TaxID=2779352 RepID=A0ABR9RCU1_9FIRM|nr:MULTISPECIES: PTS sugar transporter subunit IIC [Eubacteriales]MBE5056520.1 PTS sugar transporter subunit IIC [Pseudoflavonifractor gallinarum]MBS5134192.1 PTS sugar transporter subunit IIC [Oscillospiraceae bacterium]
MSEQANKQELTGFRKYMKEQNIEFSFNRIFIQGLGGMAHGLFASLLIGTILGTIGQFTPGAVGTFLAEVSAYTKEIQGAAMAMAIAYAMKADPYVLYSLATVGLVANKLGAAGGPLAVYFVSLVAILAGKLVSKRTPIDLIITPTVTICVGVLVANLIAPPIGSFAVWLGTIIMWATNQQPFLMGILVSVIVGIILTLPISSAAICAGLGLVGLAGGAAVAGCCAQMVGFAVCSYRENKLNGLASIGLGTSMLLVPNLLKKPILWIPPTLTAAITGPIATCLFSLRMNGAPISSGMGTSGIVGPIGVVTGWLNPSEAAVKMGEVALTPGAMDWIGMILICFVLPAILSWVISEFMRKKGWIEFGDYKLV